MTDLIECTTRIIVAHASTQALSPGTLAEAINAVYSTLAGLPIQKFDHPDERINPKDPQSSIQKNQVICLECGKTFKLLSNRHLNLHGLTPRSYKQKHRIPMTMALSARTLSVKRRKIAKELGMGKQLAAWREERKNGVVPVGEEEG